MGYNKLLRPHIIFCFIFALLVLPTFADDNSYEVVEERGKSELVQTLTWEAVKYSTGYHIIIERKNEAEEWESFENENIEKGEDPLVFPTKSNSIKLSLTAGSYRYKVFVYDIFERLVPESESKWFNFNIIKTYVPKVISTTPSTVYLDEENTGLFRVIGDHLFYDKKSGKMTEFKLTLISNPDVVYIGEVVGGGRRFVDLEFNVDNFHPGEYIFTATNLGGVKSEFSPVGVKYAKIFDLLVSGGYSPALVPPISEVTDCFSPIAAPIGFVAKVTYIPLKRYFGYFGVELTGYGYRMVQEFDSYDITANFFPITINFVYQYPIIKQKLVLDTHLGAGVGFFNNMQFEFDFGFISPPTNSMGVAVNTGISMQYYPISRFFLELGVDYIVTILKDAHFQMGVPSFSVGWQF